jgi:hypothetical protein
MGYDGESPIQLQAILDARPGESDWSTLQKVLAEHRAQIEDLQTVVRYERLGFAFTRDTYPGIDRWASRREDDSNEPTMHQTIQRPNAALRSTLRLLQADARVACHENDPARASRSLRAALRMIKFFQTPQTLLGYFWLESAARGSLQEITELVWPMRHLFSDDELRDIMAEMEGLVPKHLEFTGEVFLSEDLAQRMFSDDGQGSGRLTPEGYSYFMLTQIDSGAKALVGTGKLAPEVLGPLASALGITRKEYVDLNDQFAFELGELSKRSLWEHDPSGLPTMSIDRHFESPLWRYRALILEDLRRLNPWVIVRHQHALMWVDVAQTVIALERFKRTRGEWPASLHDLVPEFLATLPLDRYIGAPLGYLIRDGEPVLYCVGDDFDDDRGTRPTRRPGYTPSGFRHWPTVLDKGSSPEESRTPPPDGDWVLLPEPRD